ncbi:MAG TPA: FecR domain-containing protein [Flavisolibacter sp.]
MNDRFAQLIARKLSGEASTAELDELHSWLAANPEAQYFYEVFSNFWNSRPETDANTAEDDDHFRQIIALAEQEEGPAIEPGEEYIPGRGRLVTLRRVLAAAMFIGLAVCTYLFFIGRSDVSGQAPVNEVVARTGARSHLLLPDGSKVWLNSESKLVYQGSFNDTIREVHLEGEAFFDVVKDAKRPFIVHTSDIDIRVLGTAFNVKSYPRETLIEATLIRGMIEVTNKNAPKAPKVILRPHEKLVFNKEKAPAAEEGKGVKGKPEHIPAISITALPKNMADSSLKETSWVYNKINFDGDTFRELAQKMERWYNVHIRFSNDKVADFRLHGSFANETVEEALQALQYIAPFRYKISGNEIEILKQ